jgi:iron complex outermembrane receptor protein
MRIHTLLSAGVLAMLCGTGRAETATGPAPASPSQSDDQITEIIVTATRRSESIEKVPISIAAFSQSDLIESGIKKVSDIAAMTPGVGFAVPNGLASTVTAVTIRGLNANTGASVVGIYLDDVPIQARLSSLGNVGSPYPAVFDLNRVEIARGPQGTLFGAGSEAGTLRFITNSPSLTTFTGFSHAELASTERGSLSYEVGAAVGGPLIEDKVGLRISVWYRHDGGYVDLIDPIGGGIVDRNVNQAKQLAVKTALAVQATDDIRVTPSVFYQKGTTFDSGRFFSNFSDPSAGRFNNGPLVPEVATDRFVVPAIKVEAHLPFAELTSTTSFFDRKVDVNLEQSAIIGAIVGPSLYGQPLDGGAFPTSPSDIAPTPTGQTDRAFTEEVRLASNQPDAFFTWVAGIFNDHRNQMDFQLIYSQVLDPTGAPIQSVHQLITDDQTALFAQGDFHLTHQWTATLGARVAKVKSRLRVNNGNGLIDAPIPLAYAYSKETPITPQFVLSYQADRNNLFYVSAGKGFRVGGGNIPLATFCNATEPSSYDSDYVWSYELGAKNKLFDGKLQIDSSVYHVDWSKIQQLISLPCLLSYTTNGGSAVSNGFDIALQALVTDRLRVNLNVGYVDAYFTSSVYDSAGNPLVLKNYKIGSLPQVSSPWDVSTSANYKVPLPQGDIHLRGEYLYHSRNPGPFIDHIPTSPSYLPLKAADPTTHLFNARMGATIDKVDVTLFVDNVFNSHPKLGQIQYAVTSDFLTLATFRPRTMGLSFNVDF